MQPLTPTRDFQVTDLGPCELWPGRIRADGYGTVGSRLAHRVAWEARYGPIPDGLELDHLCSVRACVRLDHLELVTHAENLRRTAARGRHRHAGATCPEGHLYDRLWQGKRYCSTCRNAQLRAAGAARREAAGCPRCGGPWSRGPSGRRVCAPCATARGKAAMAARWHGATC